jgi:hypothetical protein
MLAATINERALDSWRVAQAIGEAEVPVSKQVADGFSLAVGRNVEFRASLKTLAAAAGSRIGLRCTLWRDHLPVDAMPLEGLFEVRVATEQELAAGA